MVGEGKVGITAAGHENAGLLVAGAYQEKGVEPAGSGLQGLGSINQPAAAILKSTCDALMSEASFSTTTRPLPTAMTV